MHERSPAHEKVRRLTMRAERRAFTRGAIEFQRHLKSGNKAAAAAVVSGIATMFAQAAAATPETASDPTIQAEVAKIQALADQAESAVQVSEEAALEAYASLTNFLGDGPFHDIVATEANRLFMYFVEGQDTLATDLEAAAAAVRSLFGL